MKQTINKVPDIFFDIQKLKFEYETHVVKYLNHVKNKNDVTVHSFFAVYHQQEKEILHDMTYTKEVISVMKSVCEFKTVIFRVVHPNTAYNWHVDTNIGFKNWHIPIVSNKGCIFVFQTKNYLMPADGSLYEVAAINLEHTFINAGKEDRVHLLFENEA